MTVSALGERGTFGSLSPPHLRPVLYIVAQMLLALATAMLLPALLDLAGGDSSWMAFLFGSGVTFACGAGLAFATRCRLSGGLTLRQSFLLTPLAYVTLVLFAALPSTSPTTRSWRTTSPTPSSRPCPV
jgi:trk system potassium uptake protein TrkH